MSEEQHRIEEVDRATDVRSILQISGPRSKDGKGLAQGRSRGSWPSPHCLATSSPVFASAPLAGRSLPEASLSSMKIKDHPPPPAPSPRISPPTVSQGSWGRGKSELHVTSALRDMHAHFVMLGLSFQGLTSDISPAVLTWYGIKQEVKTIWNSPET